MRVLITGATGFVGAHTAAAAIGAGHDVVALVRDPQKLRTAMDALGVPAPRHVVGDITDERAVAEALEGMDAVVHCAAVVSIDRRDADRMITDNLRGARNVLGAAARLGLDPIIHLSSTSAIAEPDGAPLSTAAQVASSEVSYGASKAACETVARELQDTGAPVVIVYPSGILGPAAGSALGETSERMADFVAAGMMPTRRAALSVIDVRDLALIDVALLEAGRGPRRVMCGGHLLGLGELAGVLREVTGRRFPVAPIPPVVLRGAGRVVDVAQRVLPFDAPLNEEAMTLVTRWTGTADTLDELGVELRPITETMSDSLDAWVDAGLISRRQRGARSDAPPGSGPPPGLRLPGWVMSSRPLRWLGPRVFPPFHRLVMRVSGGRTMLDSRAQPMLLLETTGARTGQLRETPLATVPRSNGRFLVVGSNFARESHPAWTSNLLTTPRATITFHGARLPVTAQLLDGDERAAAWSEALDWYPGWRQYVEVTDRTFRLFELTPDGLAA